MTKYEKLFLSFFYTGFSPKAPGTVGTIASIPFGILFLYFLGNFYLFAITAITTIIAIHITTQYETRLCCHDNQEIVIDETVGVWTTIAITAFLSNNLWIIAGLSLLTFRFFDILKPLGIGWVDKNMTKGKGVILDDILAGVYAGITNIAILSIL